MINKTTLKSLPLLSLLAAGLILSPTMVTAGYGDRSHSKSQYSHDDAKSYSKGHKRSNKHSNKAHYKSQGKSHKGNYGHSSKHLYTKRQGHYNDRAHNKRGHHNYRHDHHRDQHHTTYIVNDHHYDDYYGLDNLRFMIGLHTNNFDIVFRE